MAIYPLVISHMTCWKITELKWGFQQENHRENHWQIGPFSIAMFDCRRVQWIFQLDMVIFHTYVSFTTWQSFQHVLWAVSPKKVVSNVWNTYVCGVVWTCHNWVIWVVRKGEEESTTRVMSPPVEFSVPDSARVEISCGWIHNLLEFVSKCWNNCLDMLMLSKTQKTLTLNKNDRVPYYPGVVWPFSISDDLGTVETNILDMFLDRPNAAKRWFQVQILGLQKHRESFFTNQTWGPNHWSWGRPIG